MTTLNSTELRAQKLGTAHVRLDLGDVGKVKVLDGKYVLDSRGTELQAIKDQAFSERSRAFNALKTKVLADPKVAEAADKVSQAKDAIENFNTDLKTRIAAGGDASNLQKELLESKKALAGARKTAMQSLKPEVDALQASHKTLQSTRAGGYKEAAKALGSALDAEAEQLRNNVVKGRFGGVGAVARASVSDVLPMRALENSLIKTGTKFAESAALPSGNGMLVAANAQGKWGFKGKAAVAIGAVGAGYLGYKWLTSEKQPQPNFVEMEMQRRAAQAAAMGQGAGR